MSEGNCDPRAPVTRLFLFFLSFPLLVDGALVLFALVAKRMMPNLHPFFFVFALVSLKS